MLGAALARPDSADHVGAVLDGLLGVEGALLASEPLADDARLLVDLHVDVGRVVRGHGPRGQAWRGLTDTYLMRITDNYLMYSTGVGSILDTVAKYTEDTGVLSILSVS